MTAIAALVSYVLGMLVGLGIALNYMAEHGGVLSFAKDRTTQCIADGGSFDHCVNKYLMQVQK